MSTDKSVVQLVNDVLINSPCIYTSDIKSRTGTNFGFTNGIGYFENTNPLFPMKSGVILSTGNVLNAKGPNVPASIIDDGSDAWIGDTDLENTLLAAGITMNSKNASVIEFDFTPISSKFSFDFLFASEEYGNSQCEFSDAFAFLLTNKATGITTNLAVVPNSNTPISVVTIRNMLYNSSCPSVNAQYFGTFNGGSNADESATNYNGQTVLLNASAILEVNQTYHIKLVIADRGDTKYDSAIFIASDTFNIGQNVLGDDITISSGKAPCYNSPYIINSELDSNDYIITWLKNGDIIAGETDSKLTVTETGKYAITYQKKIENCLPVLDEIFIEYKPEIITKEPIDIYKCASSGNPSVFDLSLNTNRLKTGLDPLTEVSYHISLSDANNNSNPLGSNYSTTQINTTIYARILIPANPCFAIKDFELSITPNPIAKKPADLINCSNTNTSSFNLTSQDEFILSGLSPIIFSVKYFLTQADANTNQNTITTPNSYNSGDKVIFARVENRTDISCFSTTSFNLKVNLKPVIDTVSDIVTCEKFELAPLGNGNYFTQPDGGGTPLFAGDFIESSQDVYIYKIDETTGCASNSSFNVKIIPIDYVFPQITGKYCRNFQIPGLEFGDYFTAPDGLGIKISAGTLIDISQPLYAYFQSETDPTCIKKGDFAIEILPEIVLENIENVFDCVSYTLPPLTVGNYYSDTGGPNGTGTLLNAGDDITSTQKIFIYAISPDDCESEKSFDVIIGLDIKDISQCEPFTLPELPIGNYYTERKGGGNIIASGTLIDTSQSIYIYVPSSDIENCTDDINFKVEINQPKIDSLDDVTVCEYYELPVLTQGEYYTNPNGEGDKKIAGDKIFKTQTIYIYLVGSVPNCSNESSFLVTVTEKPVIDSRDNIDVCNSYVLTDLANGKYYTDSHYSEGTPTLIPFGTTITDSQTIYIYAETPSVSDCTSENSFEIKIFKLKADAPEDVISCVSYTLPSLSAGNNYYTESGGPTKSTAIPAGKKIDASTTLYIYTESGQRQNCWDENSFSISIVNEPVANSIPNSQTIFCDEDGTNDGIALIDLSQFNEGLLGVQTSNEFKIEYFITQSDAVLGNNPIISTDLKTVFAKVTNTSTINQCFDIRNINITVNKIPEPKPVDGIICYENSTNTLLKSYTITTGLSNNLYDFEWQNETGEIVGGNNNTYEAKTAGKFTIKATNKSTNCSSTKIPVTIIASEPAIFTYTVTEDFSKNPIITVIAEGQGDYEYQLDDNLFQNSTVFNNVTSGTHTITVRDKNGCGIATTEALIINYPKFFTPNDDGFNDTWNITDVKDFENTNLQIFDRFGKLLTNIKPNGEGWNGYYNGQKLPSTDYWFVITYDKDGIQKIFKSHFSLKR